MWIPVNKFTGVRYPAITQEEKAWYENPDSPTAGKFWFEAVKSNTPTAPAPTEAKQVQVPKEEK